MPADSSPKSNAAILEISRVFKAPLASVWAAWSTAENLQKWWGPAGCTLKAASLDSRPGGFFHYEMKYSSTPSMWGRFLYRDIVDGERIVWLNSFANARGGIARAPFAPSFPFEVQNTVTFTSRGAAAVVALQALPFGATDAEIQAFKDIYDGMTKDYGATLDQLEAHLGG